MSIIRGWPWILSIIFRQRFRKGTFIQISQTTGTTIYLPLIKAD